MLKTLWKISIRNILKHKVYSAINVFGLSLGFTAFILIGLFIRYDVSWDKSNEKYDRIYRIQRHYTKTMYAMDGNDISPHSRPVTAQLLEKEFPEFEKITVIHQSGGKFIASEADRQVYDDTGISADSCYFDVFTYHFPEGTQAGALDEPFTVVLSQSMAEKLFPGGKALGKTVTLEKKYDLKVTGVYEDLPENTTINASYILSFLSLKSIDGLTRSSTDVSNCMNFALIRPNVDYKVLESKIKNVFSGFSGSDIRFEELQLCPLSRVYLSFNGQDDYIIVLYLFGLIGLFILIMSAFNYINLTTANASTRGKEVAIKKVSGSNRMTLFVQFLGETMIISLLALWLAFMLTRIFLPVFSMIVERQIEFNLTEQWNFILLTVFASIVVGLISGIYPALYMSSQKILMLFKGNSLSGRKKKFSFKKILVTSQFAISVFLILITIGISLQIKYMLEKDLGFEKENILYTQMTVSKEGMSFDQLRNRMLQNPEITDASMSKHVPMVSFGGGMTNWEGGDPNEKISCRFNEANYDFVRNMGITLIAGRDFSRDYPGDIGKACLINEAAADCFGWDNPIGKRLNNNRLTVVGVMKNYIYKDMHNSIEPAIVTLAPDNMSGYWTFAFRTNAQNQQKAKAILTREFDSLFPSDPFEFKDLPTTFANDDTFVVYHSINQTILFFTVFNIFLAMIGLLGLVSYTVVRRTKEIGVRKINGSTAFNIFYILSKEYFILMFFSLLLAFPSAYLAYEYLPGAYRQPTQPWIFLLGAAIITVIIILTTSYQTYRAATRNPVEALRYE